MWAPLLRHHFPPPANQLKFKSWLSSAVRLLLFMLGLLIVSVCSCWQMCQRHLGTNKHDSQQLCLYCCWNALLIALCWQMQTPTASEECAQLCVRLQMCVLAFVWGEWNFQVFTIAISDINKTQCTVNTNNYFSKGVTYYCYSYYYE